MIKKLLSIALIFTGTLLTAQVGIGTITPNAELDITSTNNGLLIPRIALTATNVATVVTPTVSELVYNTATSGIGALQVTPGYYYWNGTQWIRLATGSTATGTDWSILGNAATSPALNFLGTTDNVDFVIRTNNSERIRLKNNGAIGIGTTTPNGALEINSTTQGVVPPRVALTSIILEAPVTNPNGGSIVPGTFVWNTATAGTAPNNVAPGLYYWTGSRWVAFAGSPGGFDWSLKGNSGTNNGTDFLGTTDAEPLVIKVNNTERIRMGTAETVINEDAQNYDFRVEGVGEQEMFFVDASTNHVHIRAASPFPTIDMFTSVGAVNDYPINGYSTGQGNAAIYGQHQTLATGTDTNVAGAFDAGGFGYPIIAGNTIGISAGGNQIGGVISSNATTGDRWGLISRNSIGTVVGAEARLAGYGLVTKPLGGGPPSRTEYYGGYFTGGQTTGDYAFVGLNYNNTNYKIIGAGSVSTIVKDTEGKERVLFCPEAPEILFEDYGVGKLINGIAEIKIDPIFSKNIIVNDKHPLKVFIQLEGDCNGVFVINKSNNSFTVKELAGGNSNVSFSWHIVANRIDTINEQGITESKHEDVRFPYGPSKLKPLEYDKAKIKPSK